MPYYIVANIRIDDPETYAKYQEGFLPIFAKYRGELLGVSDEPRVIEGEWPYTRAVLLRFADEAAATAWYESPEYQAIVVHRLNASEGSILGFQGFA